MATGRPEPAADLREETRVEAAAMRAEAGTRRAAAIDEAERQRRRIWGRGLLAIAAVTWVGVLVVLWSFHTTNVTLGRVAFWGGLGLGDGGALLVFVRTWRRAERVAPH